MKLNLKQILLSGTMLAALLVVAVCCNAQETAEAPADKTAQRWPMKCDNPELEAKTKELVEVYKKQGYLIYNGGFFTTEHRTVFPIMVHLKAKTIYHFIVVGQPGLDFLQVALGHEAFGDDEVRDRIRGWRDKTHFTHFAYVAPFEGNFLLGVQSDVKGKKSFTTAIYVMVKPRAEVVD
jgi:hypothetical protein